MADLSRGKRALFWAILALFAYVLVEAAAAAVYFASQGKLPSFAALGAERAAIVAAADRTQAREVGTLPVGNPPIVYEVLHPYLGYVLDPMRTGGFSEYGFPDADVKIYPKDPGRVVIAIFGGSFAHGLAANTKEVFARELAKSPRFAGKEVKVLAVAMGGYKQPQQLLALAWMIAMGAHFDYVINLDGFNEVVLPTVDNVSKGVSPFYPRNWSGRVGAYDATMFALAREHAGLVDDRKDWASLFSRAPLAWSVAGNVLWKGRDKVLDSRIQNVNVTALAYRPKENVTSYYARGPKFVYANDGALYDDLARMWKDSSVQMKALAEANGMTYLHFLQPNQYVAGSKEMSPEERKAGYDEAHPYRNSVVLGYPRLRAGGEELRRRGVQFFDLTMSLAGHKEPLYTDTCCHLSEAGYRLLAVTMAEKIVK